MTTIPTVPVWWLFGGRGIWDMCMIDAALSGQFGQQSVQFEHHVLEGKPLPEAHHGRTGIFIVLGTACAKQVELANAIIAKAGPSVIAHMGDESHDLSDRLIVRPFDNLWRQAQAPGEDRPDRYLTEGWRSETVPTIEKLRAEVPEKDLLWAFSGQVTHSERMACYQQLKGRKDGQLVGTGGFGQGLAYDDYIRLLLRCKVAPCPSGPVTADTIRLHEALEAGCLPVCNRRAPGQPKSFNYWETVFGCEPFPCVDSWDELPGLLDKLSRADGALDWSLSLAGEWWRAYKSELRRCAEADVLELMADRSLVNPQRLWHFGFDKVSDEFLLDRAKWYGYYGNDVLAAVLLLEKEGCDIRKV